MVDEETRRHSNETTSYGRISEEEKSTITLFSEDEIEVATNDFSNSYNTGEGGYVCVYRGYILNSEVTVMVLGYNSLDFDEFFQEFEALGRTRHPNIVKFIGASAHSLVFEFLPNGSVEDCLRNNPSILTWQIRTSIIYQICSTLNFLHSNQPQPVVHGNITPANILLDARFRCKIFYVGFSKFLTKETGSTEWYIDPEFLESRILTPACDMYSFGMTILRLLTGKSAYRINRLFEKPKYEFDKNSKTTMVDPTAGNWPPNVSKHLAYIALKCCRKIGGGKSVPAEEIMTELQVLLDANDFFMNKEKTFVYRNKNLSILNSTSTSSVKVFLYSDIERATNGLSESLKIGHGGYGSVYKGYLDDNTVVAIKTLDAKSEQGTKEFNKELAVLGQLQHENLVKLIGACFQQYSLVYEFLSGGSLEDCLKKSPRLLTWQIRTRIVYEICSGLIFLHSNKPQPLLHGDLKPANILLDGNFHIKLADFGLGRFLPEGTDTKNFHKTKNFQGTKWYIDPDYLETGNLNTGCDVYSFGVTILRILTGKSPANIFGKVHTAYERKLLMEMVDSTGGAWPDHVVEYLARIGLRCCDPEGSRSELMKEISSGLKNILDEIDS